MVLLILLYFFLFFYRKSFQISYRAFFFPISTSNRDHLSSNFNFIFGGKKKSILRAESKKGTKIREFLFCHRFRYARVQ